MEAKKVKATLVNQYSKKISAAIYPCYVSTGLGFKYYVEYSKKQCQPSIPNSEVEAQLGDGAPIRIDKSDPKENTWALAIAILALLISISPHCDWLYYFFRSSISNS